MVKELYTTVKDVPADKFIAEFSKYLKSQKVVSPEWTEYVKTSTAKDMCPSDADWFITRCAAVARRVYMFSNVGVGKLIHVFGGPERRGSRPTIHKTCSRSIVRRALRVLENLKIVEQREGFDGRFVSKSGRLVMNQIAEKVLKEQPPVLELI